MLLARGWAETEDADPSYVWVTMRRLRQKVEVDANRPVHLLTVRGVGYRLITADVAVADGSSTDPSATDGNLG
jgi:DNA-binding response OmpR family regulator